MIEQQERVRKLGRTLRLGARQSALSRLQALVVGKWLSSQFNVEFSFRESLGDLNQSDPLWKMPEKGVFTSDFRDDLLKGHLDLVVHSYKDLPTDVHDSGAPTQIIAYPHRADPRDVLLFKRSRVRPSIESCVIASSSPRREYNLKPFLTKALPGGAAHVEFVPIRGNIQTRVRKLLESNEVDGLIVAKAALDRLLGFDESAYSFTELNPSEALKTSVQLIQAVRSELLEWMNQLELMVLPLSVNPTAASQGALAIEVLRSRSDLVQAIADKAGAETCEPEVLWERSELKRYGGGCHQKIGVSRLSRAYGDILSVRGCTDLGETLNTYELKSNTETDHTRPWPSATSGSELYFGRKQAGGQLKRVALSDPELRTVFNRAVAATGRIQQHVYVTRVEAWPERLSEHIRDDIQSVWTAGVITWFKLAQRGVWVHGTTDGLGDLELPKLESNQKWLRLTHDGAVADRDDTLFVPVATYSIFKSELDAAELKAARFYYWMSASQFEEARSVAPEITEAERFHASGPGLTHRHLAKCIRSDRLRVALDLEAFHQLCGVNYE